IFMNQNRTPVLRDASVRAALETMIDRQELIERAVDGFGLPSHSPIPADWIAIEEESSDMTPEERRAADADILVKGGWTTDQNGRWEREIDGSNVPLILTVRSANGSLIEKIASYLTEVWQALGVEVTFEFYEQGDLVQTIIRP